MEVQQTKKKKNAPACCCPSFQVRFMLMSLIIYWTVRTPLISCAKQRWIDLLKSVWATWPSLGSDGPQNVNNSKSFHEQTAHSTAGLTSEVISLSLPLLCKRVTPRSVMKRKHLCLKCSSIIRPLWRVGTWANKELQLCHIHWNLSSTKSVRLREEKRAKEEREILSGSWNVSA